jgi:hypothetical protein
MLQSDPVLSCIQTEESELRLKKVAEVEREHSSCGEELLRVKNDLMTNISAQQYQHAKAVSAFETELRDLKVKVYDLTSENVSRF